MKLSQEALANLSKHKYSGIDDSILAKLMLRRYWDFCIKLVPTWIAPNLITLTGTFVVIFSFLLVGHYSPEFEGSIPTWIYYFSAAALFFYQTMDNLDGRQARRTGTSSPLGQLFDHGCDSIVCTLQSLTATSIIGQGAGFLSLFQLFSTALLPFWMATWEEYHTGVLHLGPINGPDEGIVIICLLFVFTGYFGSSFWGTPLRFLVGDSIGRLLPTQLLDVKINVVMNLLMAVPITVTCVVNIRNVIRHVQAKGKSATPALMHILVWVIMTVCAFTWYYTSTSTYQQDSIWIKYPRTVQLSIGVLFGELVSRLILSHMCHLPYKVLQVSLYPIIISTLLSVANYCLNKPTYIPQEGAILFVFTTISFGIYSIFVKETIQQLCSHLKIKCLSIPTTN
ncbi:hypothetical protein SAMD00019534_058700, partial [Acytostelium subglobosum LB1]|uniref:hypothetical protein n=1 Tax=Acytostelium subglobosum LB1 TaxID=1410327 RepID=UPI0006451139